MRAVYANEPCFEMCALKSTTANNACDFENSPKNYGG